MRWLASWLWLLPAVASAQLLGFPPGAFDNRAARAPAPVTYTGPLDVVGGAAFCYSLRACSASFATGSNLALTIELPSTATQGINIKSNGDLDIASANTFAGVHTTCTSGSASSSTTLALVGCGATPNVGDTITGTVGSGSLVQPAFVVSVGSFVGGAGNVTLNQDEPQTVTLSSVSLQNKMPVSAVYDQTGNGWTLTQGTQANQPQLLPNCGNNLPCLYFSGASNVGLGGSNPSLSMPATLSVVMYHYKTTEYGVILGFTNQLHYGLMIINSFTHIYMAGSLNTVLSNTITPVTNGGPWLAVAGVASTTTNAANIKFNGGSAVTGTLDSVVSAGIGWGMSYTGASNYIGYQNEAIAWPSGLSDTQQNNICHNQVYWSAFGC